MLSKKTSRVRNHPASPFFEGSTVNYDYDVLDESTVKNYCIFRGWIPSPKMLKIPETQLNGKRHN